MNEWLMIAWMALGGTLFAIGGTGYKWVRRYLLPAVSTGFLLYFGIEWYMGIAAGITMGITNSLGYGESKEWYEKVGVAISYSFPSAFLGFSIWQIMMPLAFIGLFYLSNTKFFEKQFPWKVCEYLTGTLQVCTLLSVIGR